MNNYDISYEYDIVPELLEKIKADFFSKAEKSAELERLLLLVRSGKANFIDAHEFSTKLGQILSEALQNNISGLILPDGKMHFNIASRILNETLGTNHKMVSTYAKQVQETLNKEAGIGLKSIQNPINQERINGLVNRLSYEEKFDDVSWILKEPIVNFSQNIVDNHIKVNADFHFKSGLKPKIVRTTDGNCCAWCSKLAGVYTYPGVNKDVFRRHDRCTCTVDYHPGDGKKQNVWSKKWSEEDVAVQSSKRIDEYKLQQIKDALSKIDLNKATPNDIIEIGKQVSNHFDIVNHIGDKDRLKSIFSNFREIGGSVSNDSWAKGSSKAVKDGLEEAFSYYPKEWSKIPEKHNKKILARKSKRGFFYPGALNSKGNAYDKKYPDYKDGYLTIATDGIRKTVPYHEIGHFIEWANPNVLRIEKEWVDSRTVGENPISLKKIFPNLKYRVTEVTKKDNFISPYIGKEYPDFTEVLSMGLQGLFEPSEKFLQSIDFATNERVLKTIKDDLDFLHLTVGLILKG